MLETLELSFVKVGKIWDNQLAEATCFQNLVTLLVNDCGLLKNLFSCSVAANLVQLKRLEIVRCNMMEEIISTNEVTDKLMFPRLNSLKLQNLQELTKFCSANLIEFPLLTELFISECRKLKTFVSNSEENCNTLSLFNENVRFLTSLLFFIH